MDNKVASLISYLKTASAETRHVVMRNYPEGLPLAETVACLKDDPTTEKATALLMYWMMSPRFSKQFEPAEAAEKELEKFGEVYFDLIEDLERKYLDGFYTAQTVGYDPYYDYSRDSGYFGEKRRVPSIMNVPVYGKNIDTAAYDRDHDLQKGLTAELLAILHATEVQGEKVQGERVEEEDGAGYEVRAERVQGEKVQGERVEVDVWKSEEEVEEEVEEKEEEREEEVWGKVEDWGRSDENDDYDPYAPSPIPETHRPQQNNKLGCGVIAFIFIIVTMLMRMCENQG